jgi:ADP-ribose pyrophosphatase YjhB (NUDIX family)
MVWANPKPVAVGLVPIVYGERTGLLVVRRGIEPELGRLCLVGGFVEEHERWQAAIVREAREEADLILDEQTVTLFDAHSTEPRPNLILIFGTTPPIEAGALPRFTPNTESTHRGVIFGPGGLDDVIGFPLHRRAARRWFAERGVSGPHDHIEL